MVLSKSIQTKITSQTNFEGIQLKEPSRSKHTFEMKPLEIHWICMIQLRGDLEITDRVDHALGQPKLQHPKKAPLVIGVPEASAGDKVDSFQTEIFIE